MTYPEAINIPFRDKVFPCRLTHRIIMEAERELGLNILYFVQPRLLEQPIAYQMAAWLYILLKSTKLKNVTLDECFIATLGEHKEEYGTLLGKFIEQLNPLLMEVNGFAPTEEVEEEAAPLDATSGGEPDGPPPA